MTMTMTIAAVDRLKIAAGRVPGVLLGPNADI